MKLRRLTAAGFRGFNSQREIIFHDKLTLISAPNSHGKTSITEALEFLLFGQTSKVESADSKEEYKDSHLNSHYPATEIAFVEACCIDSAGLEMLLRVEIDGNFFRRYLNGKQVEEWPFQASAARAARPFVVQHALKRLLLASPADRFQGFARLLGLHDVDEVQQALVNLCTKPEAQIPRRAKDLLQELTVFDARLRASKETQPIAKDLARGPSGVSDAFAKLHDRGTRLIGKSVHQDELSTAMISLRSAAAEKIYAGSVAIKGLTTADQRTAAASREKIERIARSEFVNEYARVVGIDALDRIRKELQLLGLGLDLLGDDDTHCPFCQQDITESTRDAARHRHDELKASVDALHDPGMLRTRLLTTLKELAEAVSKHSSVQLARITDLIAANSPEASQKIMALFGKGNEHSLFLVAAAGAAVMPSHKQLTASAAATLTAVEVCSEAIRSKSEDTAPAKALLDIIEKYLLSADAFATALEEVSPTLAEPTRLLQQAVDAHAGTSELSLLIELLAAREEIARGVQIRHTLDGLKILKKKVDQAVGQTMENAFSSDLTGAVMSWYQRIRTTSDPDVHFSGFAMDRTKAGDFRNRRVKVGAQSYGVELVSAVSSLSESKLNALGLCMSIATTLRAPGPWGFLILDDPIQSWDDEHEIQFIEIIRSLIEEEGRQLVLLSHRGSWIDQVASGCRTVNGTRYHITSYTREGPHIQFANWATIDQRLSEALAISKNTTSTPVTLQQAEEEIRIAACQLAADVSQMRLGRAVGAHNINSEKARLILTEAGCPSALIDRVVATFKTTDPAHHAQKGYSPSAERIRQYHGSLVELKNWLKSSPAS